MPTENKRERLLRVLTERIADGTYPVGELLPPASQLRIEFTVSQMPLRQTLDILKERGLIETDPGLGMRVVAKPPAAR